MREVFCYFVLNLSLLLGIFPVAGRGQPLNRYEFEAPQMGTTFRIVLYESSLEQAAEAAQSAFHRVDELNRVFSDYESDSEIKLLTAKAKKNKRYAVSEDLWNVLVFAQSLSRKTKGAFDVTVGPLSKLWRRAFRRREFPAADKIKAARKRVNFRYIKLYPDTRKIAFKRTDLQLDFGGIAKGYTVDEVAELLRRHGVTHFLIDGGGDLLAGEAPPDKTAWEVVLLSDEQLPIEKKAVAASGDTYRFLEWKGKRHSHIINPKTGIGVTHRTAVTVAARDCMTADAWASALSVLGREKGQKLIEKKGKDLQVYFFNLSKNN